jgi:hypothetical protein
MKLRERVVAHRQGDFRLTNRNWGAVLPKQAINIFLSKGREYEVRFF